MFTLNQCVSVYVNVQFQSKKYGILIGRKQQYRFRTVDVTRYQMCIGDKVALALCVSVRVFCFLAKVDTRIE